MAARMVNPFNDGFWSRMVLAALGLVCVSIALSGCGGGGGFGVQTTVVPYTDEQVVARESAAGAQYRVRRGDRLHVAFKYEPDLDQENVLVLPDGNITVAGTSSVVPVAGLTVNEVDETLTAEFANEYRYSDLSIIVTEIGDPEIFVLGMVEKPGKYRLPYGGTGVLQAVASAGGFKAGASKSETVVLRATDEGFLVRSFDLAHIESDGFSDLSYFDLQPYDVVYVPQSAVGDFAYLAHSIFRSMSELSSFFWDVYAISNLNKIDRIVR